MAYRIHCDWCGERIYERDHAMLEVIIKRFADKTTLGRRWAEEVRTTRHFCANERVDRDRMGLDDQVGDDGSCYARAIAAITGTSTAPPDFGMEWRLVPISGATAEADESEQTKAPVDFSGIGDDFSAVLQSMRPNIRFAVIRAGLTSFEVVESKSDDEILALPRIGHGVLKTLRSASAHRRPLDGAALAQQVLDVLVDGLPRLPAEDSMHEALAQTLPALREALEALHEAPGEERV